MLGLTGVKLALVALAVAGGGTAVGVTLTTSGPLAHDDSSRAQQAPPSQAASPTVASPTAPSTAPSTGGTLTPTETVKPTDLLDVSRLPTPDTSTWKQATTAAGSISVRIPSDWAVTIDKSNGLGGKVVGEGLSASKPLPPGATPQIGKSIPGRISLELVTGPAPVSQTAAGEPVVMQTVSLAQRPGGAVGQMKLIQYGQSKQFPDIQGAVVFVLDLPAVNGVYLSGSVSVHMPATAMDLATAREVLAGVVQK